MSKLLFDVPKGEEMNLIDGQVLKNLHDLVYSLEQVDDFVLEHHVNENRNDFHDWVKDVHQDDKLANELLSVASKQEISKVVVKRIKQEQKAIKKRKLDIPKPPQSLANHLKLQIIAGCLGLSLVIFVIGLTSHASITGAVIGVGEEVGTLGFVVTLGIIIVSLISLIVIRRHYE